jgi:Arc/MetJ family transcription regulator
MQAEADCAPSNEPEWLSDLRQELIEVGYDAARVDALLAAAVEQLRPGRVREYVPVLVKHAVRGAARAVSTRRHRALTFSRLNEATPGRTSSSSMAQELPACGRPSRSHN